jgi:hypothetical protein
VHCYRPGLFPLAIRHGAATGNGLPGGAAASLDCGSANNLRPASARRFAARPETARDWAKVLFVEDRWIPACRVLAVLGCVLRNAGSFRLAGSDHYAPIMRYLAHAQYRCSTRL